MTTQRFISWPGLCQQTRSAPGQHWCRLLLCLLTLCVSPLQAFAAEESAAEDDMPAQIQILLAAPAHPIQAGSRASIDVLFTNSTTATQLFHRPGRIHAHLTNTQGDYPLHLVLASTQANPEPSRLAPQAWDKASYLLELPLELEQGVAQLRILAEASLPSYVLIEAAPTNTNDSRWADQSAAPQTDEPSNETPLVEVVPVAQSVDEEASRNLFLDNFYTYEPLYFLFGTDPSNAKFQISFKYRFVDEDSRFANNHPWLSNFFVAYTQTSFWDLASESAPFRDTNFKPEILYQFNDVRLPSLGEEAYFDFRAGYQHESNGQSGADSRSLNIAYLEPAFHWNVFDDYQLSIASRIWTYVGATDGNDDIRDFRGRSSLTATLTQDQGFQLEAYVRGNPGEGHGSLQLDLSYPVSALSFFNLDFYLYGQFFTGYGESLLDYNRKDTRFRLGLGIVR